ncbi:MAG: PilZ domain-containing protein [Nitrospira sp.]|nr:PilZ domain-containing protein [Nitrospira sp.]
MTMTAALPIYRRVQHRIPLAAAIPILFNDNIAIGEGQVTNLTPFGCTVECPTIIMTEGPLSVRLLLPDQHAALSIDVAAVRWADGRTMGLEFIRIEPAADLRLHCFIWDLMLERIVGLVRETSPVPYSA